MGIIQLDYWTNAMPIGKQGIICTEDGRSLRGITPASTAIISQKSREGNWLFHKTTG